MPAMAQEKFEQGKPNSPEYAYLNDYAPLKAYVDRAKYPNFKLGVGTTVNDYLQKSLVYKMTNQNFDETVAGNAMKMASCVSNTGSMNFNTVTRYVNEATAAGLVVYGHTLAWHSQQPNGWLRGLIADKPAPPIQGDTTVTQAIASKDFTKDKTVGWHADYAQYSFNVSFTADGMKVSNSKAQTNYFVQYVGMSDINTEVGVVYTITMKVKGTGNGYITAKLGDWGSGNTVNFNFNTEWQEVKKTIKATVASSFLLLQSGAFVGDYYIKDIKITKEVPGIKTTEDRRHIKVATGARTSEAWDNQMWLVLGSFAANAKFEFSAEVRADKAAHATTQIHNAPGSYVGNGIGNINFTTDWRTVRLTGTLGNAGQSIALNLSELADANNYYFDNVSFKVNGVEKIKNGDFEGTDVSSFKIKVNAGGNAGSVVAPTISETLSYVYSPSTIPQTKEEKYNALVGAMDKWIKGMMEACGGKVKAWDVVNEAISGGGNDGEGNYLLQHSDGYTPDATWDVGGDAFYWQDYLGDIDYVRQAIRLARKYGPEDVKLFINDYNLESDWDQNKKLKSLINWIKKWEADGVTKVDGIGTQMHISYYENASTQNSKKNAITNMFKLMAATGKLVRVSEMDMGYVKSDNKTSVATSAMTEEMHHKMADFYEWIIKEYLRLVPPAQQWGICQWCATDSPSNSGWRADTPVGIWDLNNYRKHVYAGFAKGLGGDPTPIETIVADAPTQIDGAIYDLRGIRLSAKSLDELPRGIYVVNGRKVAK